MNRRTFTAAILGTAASLGLVVPAMANPFTDYTPGVIENALKAGKTVFVDYAADWCGTCRAQERVIGKLVEENPEYTSKMLFVRVDWDDYGSEPVATDRNIPRRSTLLVLRGNEELGRIVAGTSTEAIKELMDKGL